MTGLRTPAALAVALQSHHAFLRMMTGMLETSLHAPVILVYHEAIAPGYVNLFRIKKGLTGAVIAPPPPPISTSFVLCFEIKLSLWLAGFVRTRC